MQQSFFILADYINITGHLLPAVLWIYNIIISADRCRLAINSSIPWLAISYRMENQLSISIIYLYSSTRITFQIIYHPFIMHPVPIWTEYIWDHRSLKHLYKYLVTGRTSLVTGHCQCIRD